jgi:hypothetical protein
MLERDYPNAFPREFIKSSEKKHVQLGYKTSEQRKAIDLIITGYEHEDKQTIGKKLGQLQDM